MATARPRHSRADRHFRPSQASPHWCCHDNLVNSTPSSQKRWRNLLEALTFGVCSDYVYARMNWGEKMKLKHLKPVESWVKKMNESTAKCQWLFITYHIPECVVNLTICVSPGCSNKEDGGPLSRSVVDVRLGRLIWAHSGPAQWTSSLCSRARLRSALPQRQPALLQPPGSSLSSSTAQASERWLLTVVIFMDAWMDHRIITFSYLFSKTVCVMVNK